MRLKILKKHLDDIVPVPKDIAALLNEICFERTIKWEISGLCQRDSDIIFNFEQVKNPRHSQYILAEIRAETSGDVEEEIKTHWESGMQTLGLIRVSDIEYLAFYCRIS